jgi:ankyrin repeat protein
MPPKNKKPQPKSKAVVVAETKEPEKESGQRRQRSASDPTQDIINASIDPLLSEAEALERINQALEAGGNPNATFQDDGVISDKNRLLIKNKIEAPAAATTTSPAKPTSKPAPKGKKARRSKNDDDDDEDDDEAAVKPLEEGKAKSTNDDDDEDDDDNDNDRTVLIQFILRGYADCVYELLMHGAKTEKPWLGKLPLQHAILSNSPEPVILDIVKKILMKGGDINCTQSKVTCALNLACRLRLTSVVKELIKRKASLTKLIAGQGNCVAIAASAGSEEIVQELIKAGVDSNSVFGCDDYSTPLIEAAAYGHDSIVRLLLTSPSTKGIIRKDWHNKNGETALTVACRTGHGRCVYELIQAGVNVNARTRRNESCVFVAVKHDNLDAVLQIFNANGYSAGPFHEEREMLIMSIQRDNLDMFKVLCANLRNFEINVVILNELVRLNRDKMLSFLLFEFTTTTSSIRKDVIDSLEKNNCRGKEKQEVRNLLSKWLEDLETKENAAASASSSSSSSSSSEDSAAGSSSSSPSAVSEKGDSDDDDDDSSSADKKTKKPSPKGKKPAAKPKKVSPKAAPKKEKSKSLPAVKSEPRD